MDGNSIFLFKFCSQSNFFFYREKTYELFLIRVKTSFSFMSCYLSVFNVTDQEGKKITQEEVLDYIHKVVNRAVLAVVFRSSFV